MKINELHDYVKKNYENNLYDNEYSHYEENNNRASDFDMGVQQAKTDYYQTKHFKIYPLFLVKIINKLVNNRIHEIVDFITGYNYAKNKLK